MVAISYRRLASECAGAEAVMGKLAADICREIREFPDFFSYRGDIHPARLARQESRCRRLGKLRDTAEFGISECTRNPGYAMGNVRGLLNP